MIIRQLIRKSINLSFVYIVVAILYPNSHKTSYVGLSQAAESNAAHSDLASDLKLLVRLFFVGRPTCDYHVQVATSLV